MPTNETVKTYLTQLPVTVTERFNGLADTEQSAFIFSAIETLSDFYSSKLLTDRAVALQTLYQIEGEQEEFALLSRQKVDSINISGDTTVNVSNRPAVSPDVQAILGKAGKGKGVFVGGLI